MLKLTTLVLALGTALGAGCGGGGYVAAGGTYSSSGYYASSDPSLVEIQTGVWVVEGYHQPVFYSDNYYWTYRDGHWLRSSYYDRGFVTVNVVPYRLRSIDRPYAYVRYRGGYGARVRQGPRGNVVVRDHRTPYAYNRQQQIRQERQEDAARQRDIRQERQEDALRQREIRQERQEDAARQRDIRQERIQDARQRQQQVRQERRETQQEARERAARERARDRRDKKDDE